MADRPEPDDLSEAQIAKRFEPAIELARQAVRQDTLTEKVANLERQEDELERETRRQHEDLERETRRQHEDLERETRERFRLLYARVDQLADRLSDRDREYRRNVIIVLGPVALVVLLIASKVLLGIEIGPHLP